jgi:CheY-like chemotaxis protein
MLSDLTQQMLELAEHTVACAVNGAEALIQAQASPPDLILMDIGMPIMDGHEATRRLKAHPATRAIPIIALTAHAGSADRQEALAAGANDYEPKPVDFDRLLGKIQALLTRAGT